MTLGTNARVASWLAALALWSALLIAPNWSEPFYDLSALVVGAKLVADGHVAQLYSHHSVFYNLADAPELMQAAAELGFTGTVPTAFVQAPLVAWAAQPLTRFPFPSVAHAWLVASAIAMALALRLSFDAYAPRWKDAAPALALGLLLFEPLRYNFWLGQTTPFVFLALMASLALLRRGRAWEAGLVMALPAFVKLTPLVFGLVWLWQKRWRAAIAMGAGVLSLALLSVAVMGARANVEYAGRVSEIGRIALVAFNNHSLSAMLTRLHVPSSELDKFTMFTPSLATRVIVDAVALATIAAPAWLLRRRRDDELSEGYAIVLTLLVPSIAWTHYFVLLVPVALLIATRARPALTVVMGALLLLCFRPIAPDGSAFLEHRGLVLVGPTLAALGALGLLCYLSVARSRS